MLLIYTTHITNRIKYVMHFVFEEVLGVQYSITDNKKEFLQTTGDFKIVYTAKDMYEGLYFFANNLLFEEDIKETELHASVYNNIKILFKHNKKAALNFDVFAAIFYLISRYEEYLQKPRTVHGNYDYHNSILYELNILHEPVVEQWIELLKHVLLMAFPQLEFKKQSAKFGLSFDVDVAYAYKHKNILRVIGAFAKNLLQLNFTEVKNRVFALLNKQKDKYDTYNYIFSSLKNKKPVFFFDMGNYGKFDKNPSYQNKKFRQLITMIAQKAVVGLHPSYTSNTNKNLVAIEKYRLEKIIGKTISLSRQHYLKLKLPSTYNDLISNNIHEDYTIGYSETYGFRAGTCHSFLFYDLIKNFSTNLRLFPFAYMDVSLNTYLNLNISEAKQIVSKLAETTYTYNGIFIPLWHNSSLHNSGEWKNWCEVFEHTLKEIDEKNFENLFG